MEQTEYPMTCPYCGEPITMLLDLSIAAQAFIEDCEVCCRPIEVSYRVADGEISEVSLDRAQ